MNKIVFQGGIFNFNSDIKLKDYQNMLRELSSINEILITTDIELEFIGNYLEIKLEEKRNDYKNINLNLTSKEIKRYTNYASQALRCNILADTTGFPCRDLSTLIASSIDYQTFIFAGDLSKRNVPGKTKINDFSKIASSDELKALLTSSILKVQDENIVSELNLPKAINSDIIWADATCLSANIHFPVDWILLRDAIRSIMTTIETLRKHGIIHRIKTPSLFITEVNNLCMEMTNTRRKKDSKKTRKNVLRKMKSLVTIVMEHAERYRDRLLEEYKTKTDLSEKQVNNFVNRLNNIICQIPAAKAQAHKRMISEKKINSKDKFISLYDDNASVIPRGKSGAEVEFGNELLIAEQENGLIVGWEFYKDKVDDTKKLGDMLENFSFDKLEVNTLVTDRGFSSKTNSKKLEKANIYDCLLPRNIIEMKESMKSKKYRNLQKRRSQTETRIAILKQIIGKQLKSKDYEYKAMKVGWSIFTHNLILLAKMKNSMQIKIAA